jgi:hypothetical protein
LTGTTLVIGIAAGIYLHEEPRLPASERLLAELNAEMFELRAQDIVQHGSARVFVLRFEKGVVFKPYHYTQFEKGTPLTVERWADLVGASVVFNAGQFDEHRRHLGWLKSEGRWLSPHQHPTFKGLFLSGAQDGATWARVADLEQAPASIIKRYEHGVQSMMLFDDQGHIRVRHSSKSACRSVIAEDQAGRILLLVTAGAVTLADFARWLLQQNLHLVRAMNLDGGVESQLFVRTPNTQFSFYGQLGHRSVQIDAGPFGIRYPLPAVIAVFPTPKKSTSINHKGEAQKRPH